MNIFFQPHKKKYHKKSRTKKKSHKKGPHKNRFECILIKKLDVYGIKGNLLRWFASYLSNRTQYVSFNGYKSHLIIPASGVPQGSILGPLLFVLFINDLGSGLSSYYLLYADDLKIFRKISDANDCRILQTDLNRIVEWCNANCLHLNIEKCNMISFTRKRAVTTFNYDINGKTLRRASTVKDLGILFDSKLKFDEHIEQISCKSYKMLGFLIRCCKGFRNPNTLISLYIIIV